MFLYMSNLVSNSNSNSQTSGVSGAGALHIRRDVRSRNQEHHNVDLTSSQQYTAIFGLLIYIVVFIILIPIALYKLHLFEFLKLYFVNTDLIATVISFDKGSFKDIFKYLYNDTGPIIGFISQSVINWSVLLGLFYIILSESRNKKISEGLSKISFIILLTYLLPTRFIVMWMEEFYQYLVRINKFKLDSGLFTMLFGLVLAICFICLEFLSITYLAPHLRKFIDFVARIL